MLIPERVHGHAAPAAILLDATALRRALQPAALVAAVERSLLALDRGELALAPTVHLPGDGGGFHLKSAFALAAPNAGVRRRAAVKLNGNFPGNQERDGLPTIQGVVALLDLERGSLLAIMDSTVVTALRTAAVSALAARRLARPDAQTIALVGCGIQALEHVELLARDFPLRRAALFDRDQAAAERLQRRAQALGLETTIAGSAAAAAGGAAIVVTTTSSTTPLLGDADVAAGAFVAAVGADNPTKCELAPELVARSRLVVDSLASARANGDLRAALAAGLISADAVHGELPALLAGRIPGRVDPSERWIFDSTGLAVTDLAAAELAYEAARADAAVPRFDFAASNRERSSP
jgi:ornithine cyclodeaminase/alanine dehydrogenase-like protein (mu-crystallin family)